MSISIDVDLEIHEILSSIWRKSDKIELLKGLLDDLDSSDILKTINLHRAYADKTNQVRDAFTGDDASFTRACAKINVNRWRLNLEDEEYILKLADKL